MTRLVTAAALGAALLLAGTSIAQPKGGPGGPGGQRGPMPRMKDGPAPSLDQKLDRLEAQLKDLEAKLSKLQPARGPEPKAEPKGGGGSRGFGGFPGMGPGGMGPMGGGFGRGMGPMAGGLQGNRSAPDFEQRLDRIIGELERLKKDMKGPGQRGGGGR